MTINKNLSEKPMVSPAGETHWAKINNKYDDYDGNGPRKYVVDLSFDKETEAKMKKLCDDLFAKAQSLPEFNGKKWASEAGRGYKEQKDGSLFFHFQTRAFYTDKNTGEEVQKVIPILNAATHKILEKETEIGNGSTVRISFTPSAYWASVRANGVNLYMHKLVVDNLVEFAGGASFDEFGESVASDTDDFADMSAADEEVPI